MPVPALRLEVTDHVDVDHWRWVLKDASGAFLADHNVALDRTAPLYPALYDLPGYLQRYAAPDRRDEDERRLLHEFGAWLGRNVLGECIGDKIIKHGLPPVIVRVVIPSSADQLFVLPLELAHAGGRSIAAQGASLILEAAHGDRFSVAPVRAQLRMLALFSVPPSDSPLNLRRERQMLRSLVRRLTGASGLAVELRVMQYGVTRQLLQNVLTQGDGWDVIHFSGHGLPGVLTLEKPDGTADDIPSTDMAELLRGAGQRLKLVVVSACHSAAASIEQTLNWLGISAQAIAGVSGAEPSNAPMVARTLIGSLGCAIVAMRYAVEDEFAAAFGVQLYDALIERQQSLPRAVQLAVAEALQKGPAGPLSSATPVMFGASAPDLQLTPPQRPDSFSVPETGLAYFDPEPDHFVGRVSAMTRASAALAAQSGQNGVLFYGMAGAGKSSCAVELAHSHQHITRFRAFVWYRAPEQGKDISSELRNFAVAMETQLPGFAMMHVVSDRNALARWIPKLTYMLASRAVLIVLDNLESLLTASGEWRDERWKLLVTALCVSGSLSRVVLTSRIRPNDLPASIEVVAIHSLPLNEAALLIRELPNLRKLLDGKAPGTSLSAGRELLRTTLRLVQGHPKLIELAERLASDPQRLREQTDRATSALVAGAASLDTFFETGATSFDADAFFKSVRAWVTGIAGTLSEAARTFFYFVCALEEIDRESTVISATWTEAWQRLGKPAQAPEVVAVVEQLVATGFVEKHMLKDESGAEGTDFTLSIHPAVADAGRTEAGADFQAVIDAVMADHWVGVMKPAVESFGQSSAAAQQIARAGTAGPQYLSRLGKWGEIGSMVDHVYHVDESARTAVAFLPMMRRVVQETTGTSREHVDKFYLARLLRVAGNRNEAEPLLRDIVDHPDARVPSRVMDASWMELATLLADKGRLKEAWSATEQRMQHARASGPWELLSAKVQQLGLLNQSGNYEEVFNRAPQIVQQVNEARSALLSELPIVFNVRELLFDLASVAALHMGEKIAQENAPSGATSAVIDDSQYARACQVWQQSIDYTAEQLASMARRGAPPLDLIRIRFNYYMPLLHMGRFGEARALLEQCRAVFEANNSVSELGRVFSALSTLEACCKNSAQGRRFEEMALRYKYIGDDPDHVRTSHFNLASRIFESGGDLGQALAHRIAALLLAMATGSERSQYFTMVLARDLQQTGAAGRAALPASFAALSATLKLVDGVRFEEMMSLLAPGRGDELLQSACSAALTS